MKKPSISFDRAKLTRLMTAHVEKVGIAIALVVFAWLVIGAVGQETFQWQPEDLDRRIQRAETNISQSTPDKIDEPVVPYEQQAKGSRQPIQMVFEVWRPWHPPEFGSAALRGEPKFLPAESLEIAAGFGAFDTDDGTKGYRWTVITALVPWDEQLKHYNAVLSDVGNSDPDLDVPQYINCQVQREEIGADGQPVEGSGKPINMGTARKIVTDDKWASAAEDPVPRELKIDTLVFRLGPLADNDWDSSITHSAFPLPQNDSLPQTVRSPEKADDAPAREPERRQAEGSLAAAQAANRGNLPGRGIVGREERREGQPPPPEQRQQAPFDEGDPFDDQPRQQAEPEAELQEQPDDLDRLPPHRLLRFFDFTVKPAKRYRYKVRLALQNPNYGIQQRFLEEDDIGKKSWRTTEWSESSPIVTIPRDSDLLAVGAAKKTRAAGEAKGYVIARHWDAEKGVLVPHRVEMSAGQVANFKIEGIGFLGPDAASPVKLEGQVTVNTNTMLLDVLGGDKLPGSRRRLTEPAEMLFLDAHGRLVMRDELTDQDEYAAFDGLINEHVSNRQRTPRPQRREPDARELRRESRRNGRQGS